MVPSTLPKGRGQGEGSRCVFYPMLLSLRIESQNFPLFSDIKHDGKKPLASIYWYQCLIRVHPWFN